MNPKVTPELKSALNAQPIGPIRLDDESAGEPVFLVRLADIPTLQETVDQRIREKLAQADSDIDAGRVSEWNASNIKERGRQRHSQQ